MGESSNIAVMPAFNEEISIGSIGLKVRKQVESVLVTAEG